MPTDYVDLDRRATSASVDVVGAIPDGRWDAPTPCSAWNLGELVAHMTAQHRGFAAAAAGGTDPAVWQIRPPGPDPRREYTESVRAVLAAFAEDGVSERRFALPEIRTDRTFPGRQAIGFHFVDYVVHTWDVAAAIGMPVGFDSELVDAATEVAEREIPVGPHRERPGASFAPRVVLEQDGPAAFDRLLALVGRSPGWTPPGS